jgi:hypothetical protein
MNLTTIDIGVVLVGGHICRSAGVFACWLKRLASGFSNCSKPLSELAGEEAHATLNAARSSSGGALRCYPSMHFLGSI